MEGWKDFVGRTSMEVQVEIYAENALSGERRHCCTAFLTYVALNEHREPKPVPPLDVRTDEEKNKIRKRNGSSYTATSTSIWG